MMKHRHLKSILALGLSISLCSLTGCVNDRETEASVETPDRENETISITASFYPIYALTAMIAKDVDGVTVSCLTQPSVECLRSYVISDWDAAVIASSSAIVVDGKGLESYSDALYEMGDTGPAVIAVDYDQTLLTHANILNPDAASTHYEGGSPYLYLSADGADSMLNAIAAGLIVLDPANEAKYSQNLESAHESIEALKNETEAVKAQVDGTKVIVMNEALIYTAEALGLQVEAEYARESGGALYDTELEDCIQTVSACTSRIILIEKQAPKSLTDALTDAGFTVIKLTTMSETPAAEGTDGWFNNIRYNADEVMKGITGQ